MPSGKSVQIESDGDRAVLHIVAGSQTSVDVRLRRRPGAGSALREDTARMTGFIAALLPSPNATDAAAAVLALMEGLSVYRSAAGTRPSRR